MLTHSLLVIIADQVFFASRKVKLIEKFEKENYFTTHTAQYIVSNVTTIFILVIIKKPLAAHFLNMKAILPYNILFTLVVYKRPLSVLCNIPK